MKEDYLEYAKKNFKDKALDIVIENIELFYNADKIDIKNFYEIGDKVRLKKGVFIHGIDGGLNNFDWILENGFIGNDFTNTSKGKNKIKNSIGMWNIKADILLQDYIKSYSGMTISYHIGRGPESFLKTELVSYHEFDSFTEKINNDEEIWTWSGSKTKEVSFLPSLVSNKRKIAFILNTSSDYAKKMILNDVWNIDLEEDVLIDFLDYRYYPKFLIERFERDDFTTDRESAIIFGLPSKLIEGVLIGRDLESNKESINYIKSKLPNCFICNLDGIVIL